MGGATLVHQHLGPRAFGGQRPGRARVVQMDVRQQDGGHVELAKVDESEGIVYIRFQGACQGCPSSAATLQMGIENEIRYSIPEIKQVVAI